MYEDTNLNNIGVEPSRPYSHASLILSLLSSLSMRFTIFCLRLRKLMVIVNVCNLFNGCISYSSCVMFHFDSAIRNGCLDHLMNMFVAELKFH